MKHKSLIIGILVGILITSSISIAADLSEYVRIYYSIRDIRIDNVSKVPEQAPFTIDGTTFVPLRYIAETFGYSVDWDAETQTIYLNSPEGIDEMTSVTVNPQVVEHYIDMKISQFSYEPNLIEVSQGDIIHLTITASDVGHGFRIDEYGIDEKFNSGEIRTITIEADKIGTFEFDCSVYCGTGHGAMSGQLIVK